MSVLSLSPALLYNPFGEHLAWCVQLHEVDFQHDEEKPLPPLPSVGEIERPKSAVDAATLQLPSDLSVRSLRYILHGCSWAVS